MRAPKGADPFGDVFADHLRHVFIGENLTDNHFFHTIYCIHICIQFLQLFCLIIYTLFTYTVL